MLTQAFCSDVLIRVRVKVNVYVHFSLTAVCTP